MTPGVDIGLGLPMFTTAMNDPRATHPISSHAQIFIRAPSVGEWTGQDSNLHFGALSARLYRWATRPCEVVTFNATRRLLVPET